MGDRILSSNGHDNFLENNTASRPRRTLNCSRNTIVMNFFCVVLVIIIIGLLIVKFTQCQRPDDALRCPPDWVGHQNQCYYVSKVEMNWTKSQENCTALQASLARLTAEEMDFVMGIKRKRVVWIGLNKEPGRGWKWTDGENSELEVLGNGGDCAYLVDDARPSSARCSTEHHYICKRNSPNRP